MNEIFVYEDEFQLPYILFIHGYYLLINIQRDFFICKWKCTLRNKFANGESNVGFSEFTSKIIWNTSVTTIQVC